MKIIINAISTKKLSGGAYQISQNFILKSLEHNDVDWYYIVSQDVDDAIGDSFTNIRDVKYFAFPTQPDFKNSYKEVKKAITQLEKAINPDLVYSITSPCYFSFQTKEVMRFTNPWATHPNKYAWSVLSTKDKIRTWLYNINQKRLLKKGYAYVTQTETTKRGIIRITGKPEERVKVVSNVLPAAFKSIETTALKVDDYVNIACVGNTCPHKNFDILPDVLKELQRLGIENVRFHVTMPIGDYITEDVLGKARNSNVADKIINYGRISQKDLAELYRKCQLCFLPTLLEVFSASTVEAMYFKLPIVATNFQFNAEVLADACLYYEPMNAKDAAEKVAKMIADKALQATMRERMARQLAIYGDYDAHFNAIKEYLIKVAKNEI